MWYMSTRLRVNVLVPKNVTALPMKEISCQFSEKLGLGVKEPKLQQSGELSGKQLFGDIAK